MKGFVAGCCPCGIWKELCAATAQIEKRYGIVIDLKVVGVRGGKPLTSISGREI